MPDAVSVSSLYWPQWVWLCETVYIALASIIIVLGPNENVLGPSLLICIIIYVLTAIMAL